METILQILIRIVVGSTFFYIFYALLLRKTTFFKLNRYYLLAAVLLPVLFAVFPLRYTVTIQQLPVATSENWSELFRPDHPAGEIRTLPAESAINWQSILLAVYLTGLLLLALRLVLQSIKPIRLILKNEGQQRGNYPIVENRYFPVPFSFFNYIFIHPDYHRKEDLDAILAHEEVHIRERHWIDLFVIELFTLAFWFHPISWLLEQAIKQNHEYLADQGVLSRGQSPARYQLLLVNQLMGMQVLGLSNNLNFALGPTRLNMMKKQKTPQKQLLRFGLLLPIVAGLLFAFAEPEYETQSSTMTSQSTPPRESANKTNQTKGILIKGTVVDENGDPMPGTSIILKETTIGTVTDNAGKFELKVPSTQKCSIVASFVGYQIEESPLITKDDFEYNVDIILKRAVIFVSTDLPKGNIAAPPPPPLPVKVNTAGVTSNPEETFIIVEDMPQYPGGHYSLAKYIQDETTKITKDFPPKDKRRVFTATVGFTVTANGKVDNVKLLKSSQVFNLDDDAIRIVKGQQDWTPGKQRGKAVPVDYAVRIEF